MSFWAGVVVGASIVALMATASLVKIERDYSSEIARIKSAARSRQG